MQGSSLHHIAALVLCRIYFAMRQTSLLVVLVFGFARLTAQNVSHFLSFQQSAGMSKQTSLLGYSLGSQKFCWSFSAGIANGNDNQTLSPEEQHDDAARTAIHSCQTFEPFPEPKNMFTETCNSAYSGKQVRLGFTAFLGNANKKNSSAFSGLHLGVEAAYMRTQETQTVIYKSETDEFRTTFRVNNSFSELGAITHVGWQFAFFHEHLYADVRGVLPFYYPFTQHVNVSSPFAGTKYEMQIGISWRFASEKKFAPKKSAVILRGGL